MAYSTHKVKMIVGCEGKRLVHSFVGCAGNERGVALVVALGVMVLLTILGAWVLNTSSTDLRIAGNTRNYQSAFYLAEQGMEFAKSRGQLEATYNKSLQSNPTYTSNSVSASATTSSRFLARTELGPSSGLNTKTEANWEDASGGRFKGLFYTISATGISNNAVVVLNAGIQSVAGN
jgi:Tfp pilus assembly protein PilX